MKFTSIRFFPPNLPGANELKPHFFFQYSGDADDKQWLYENHHMPATGGKAYMLLVEDVQELAETDEYRYTDEAVITWWYPDMEKFSTLLALGEEIPPAITGFPLEEGQ